MSWLENFVQNRLPGFAFTALFVAVTIVVTLLCVCARSTASCSG